MKKEYFHSVRLDKDKCMGCTNCIKRCPTDAIRVQNGKAKIIDERCIDCGECIRVCPYHAKIAYTDTLSLLNNYKYKIALPAPAIYGQFKKVSTPSQVYEGLKMLGFDEVFDVAKGADIAAASIAQKIGKAEKKPLISSACPAILRLIQVRFPELIDNIVDTQSPMEIAAMVSKQQFAKKMGVDIKEIGAFFITPCPAKMTSVRVPMSMEKSNVDGAISILDIYGILASQFKNIEKENVEEEPPSALGIGWATSGGEAKAVGVINCLAVDGIHNVIKAIEEIENGKLSDLDFFEGLACTGGCVGGPLVFENSFVAKNKLRTLVDSIGTKVFNEQFVNEYADQKVDFRKKIEPREVMKLDKDFRKAMMMMQQIEDLTKRLPGLDCGSCGSPSCRALAEDIVRGHANEMDCIFILKEKVRYLAEEMVGLASKDISNKEE